MNLSDVRIAIIGLGYVGLPLAVEFGKKYSVVGYDISSSRVSELKNFEDSTLEVTREEILKSTNLEFTDQASRLNDRNVFIVTVPTPIDENNVPDLLPLKSATKLIASKLVKNSIVIYESTVFPGATEEVCIPILEKFSKLKFNSDFFAGYSPERINPGDKVNTLKKNY